MTNYSRFQTNRSEDIVEVSADDFIEGGRVEGHGALVLGVEVAGHLQARPQHRADTLHTAKHAVSLLLYEFWCPL